MSLSKVRELREQYEQLVTKANALVNEGDITPEKRESFDKMMADAKAMQADIARIEDAQALEASIRNAMRMPENATAEAKTEDRSAKQSAAFRSYLIHGMAGLNSEQRSLVLEQRDMGTGGGNALQGTGGGYFVPVGFVNKVEDALKYYGPMLQTSTILKTATGQPLPYPTANDTAQTGAILAEAAQVSTADVTLSNLTLGAYKFTTNMVKVSIELLQDSAFDIESFLQQEFARRLGRILNTKFTVGTGTSEPKGIITAAVSGLTAAGSASNDGTGATGANSIGSDDLIGLEHSVDPLYRNGAAFMMNDATFKAIRQVKDKQGRPLVDPQGYTKGAFGTILGYPVYINNDMATIATTNKTVAFGQLDKYLVRQVKDLSIIRLDERFIDFGQVAYVGFARYDGNLLDAGTHPVKFLTQA